MKIKCLLFLLLIAFNAKYVGQVNLVMNPSFETYTACPTLSGDVNKAIGWDTCRGSSDFFHECSTFTVAQTPINLFGKQNPINGVGYAGFYTFDLSYQNAREMLIGTLNVPLNISQKYFISLRVSKADELSLIGKATNMVGVKFTTVKQFNVPVNNYAHVYTNEVIVDTINWTKIFGSFVADSAYNYIMIGNFFDDVSTTVFNQGIGPSAYYYVDEVCVSTDSLFAMNYVTSMTANAITELISNEAFDFYPNPADNSFNLKSNFCFNEFKVYTSFGSLHYSLKLDVCHRSFNVKTKDWESGIYFVRINNKIKKLVIKH